MLRRAAVLAAVLAFAVAGVAHADDGLTGRVASAYFLRTVDPGLHAIAHERVAELALPRPIRPDVRGDSIIA